MQTQLETAEETPSAPHPLDEATYKGTCYGHPCFTLEKGGQMGTCAKRGYFIMVALAKQQKLCDDEKTEATKKCTTQ